MHTVPYLQKRFQEYLEANEFVGQPEALYQPVNYILKIGGKRIRPILLLIACNIFKDNIEEALPAAFAIEVFHNFSLLHDDIMDDAPLRRGQPAVHINYGINSGILSGDVMLIHAFDYLLKVPAIPDKTKLLQLFNQVAIEVCEGQQYDMNFETRDLVHVSEYLKMIELKTAALIGAALQIGALIAGAAESDAAKLASFGRSIGIAFQLQDDILDTFGDPAKFGKKVGGDISQNKKTYLLIKAMEEASGETEKRLKDLLKNEDIEDEEKISAVSQIYQDLNIRKAAESLMEDYLAKAFQSLDQVSADEKAKQPLRDLANQLMGREI